MPLINQMQTMSAQGLSAPLLLDLPANAVPASATAVLPGILVTLSTGASLTYNVEVTGLIKPVNAAGEPWNIADSGNQLTANVNLSIVGQVGAVRLNVTSYVSGTATIVLDYMN